MRDPRLPSAPEGVSDLTSDGRRGGPWVAVVVALLLALLFALEVTSIRGKDLTYDAPDHLRYGQRIVHGDATRFDDSKMPVSAWNALPGRIGEALDPGPLRDHLVSPAAARYPTMLASLLLAWLVFHWSRELFGAVAGLLSLFLYVFDPNLLAHSRYVTTDLYCVLTITFALYAFWRFLSAPSASEAEVREGASLAPARGKRDRGRRGRSRRVWGLAAALAFGLAQIAKYTGAYLVPVLLLVLAVRFAPDLWTELRRRSFRAVGRRIGVAAGWAVVFVVAMILVVNVGFLFQDPFWPLQDFHFRSEPFAEMRERVTAVWPGASFPFPYPYVEGLDWVLARERTGEGYGNIYLLGETRSGEGFPGYFFVATAFKQPLPILLLWLLAAGAYAVGLRAGVFRFRRDGAFLLVPVAFFTLYFNFFFQAQMGIRYFLPVFPFLHVFAGCLLAERLWSHVDLPSRPVLRRGAPVALGVLGLWLVVSVLSYYPHFLPYMNELMPDRKMAYTVLADSNLSWGEDLSYVERWLDEHPEVVWQPEVPTAGTLLVGTNWLTGVFKRRHDTWIRERFEPVGHLRYGHLLFEVSEEEAERARRELGLEEAPPPDPNRPRRIP